MKLVKDENQIIGEKKQISDEDAEKAIKTIIQWLGEDPNREGLLSTPKRGTGLRFFFSNSTMMFSALLFSAPAFITIIMIGMFIFYCRRILFVWDCFVKLR